jgi:hypothetical protein
VHEFVIRSQPVPVRDWAPLLPPGEIRTVVLHWTAGDYDTPFATYHFCVCGAENPGIVVSRDLRANMRDVRSDAPEGYAAHTAGRNSFAAGIAVCAMASATPHDFARYPLTAAQIDALCTVAAALVRHYAVALDNVRTHAEAALEDGYFGADGDDVRWDIARLQPSAEPLQPAEAAAVGDVLRAGIARRC